MDQSNRLTSGKLSIFEGHELSGLHFVIDHQAGSWEALSNAGDPAHVFGSISVLGYQFSLYRPNLALVLICPCRSNLPGEYR
jgi:hypothetical protein